jgi:hypothetical protein
MLIAAAVPLTPNFPHKSSVLSSTALPTGAFFTRANPAVGEGLL